ncbi:10044_t:CDS:2 [Funneliformis mosseae]|uniref:10044_t:CDS:1 n=1 Tax=Funneliformis mosseae TaxID=27381 RepID=A0A9N9E400_FUNMO|nr:10044_t:CDS:2 [Funneliformis mosseae]
MFRHRFSNVRKTSTFPIRRTRTSTRTSKFPSTRKSSTLPGRTSVFPDSTRRTYNVLNQKVTYTLKEFLAEYEGRAKEASARMEKSINDKIASLNDKVESHSSSVNDKIESRISNAENKMLYLFCWDHNY